jgi:hypothetical protein
MTQMHGALIQVADELTKPALRSAAPLICCFMKCGTMQSDCRQGPSYLAESNGALEAFKKLNNCMQGVHSLIAEVTGWNILSPIVTAVHTILNVPQPMTLAAARKVAPAESTSANSKKRN